MEPSIQQLKQVLIVGSGTLGMRIGLQCALSGYSTTMYDIHAQAFEAARRTHEQLLRSFVKKGELTDAQAREALDRIRWTTNLEEATKEGVDFVSESVTEAVDIKKRVWQEVGRYCPRHAILTTNTSSLLPSQFAQESGNPENFCAYHFHDVFWANVVDIMPHPGTRPEVVAFLRELSPILRQIPVVLKAETPGYVFNALLGTILDTAGLLVAYGKTTVQDVDRSWMGNFKTPSGPFGMLDAIGLDTAWHVSVARPDKKSQRFAAFLKEYIDAGKLGIKTGEGFYTYPDPEYKRKDFLQG
jgi:3-hydroxybutyryl-CoA dehydrogenase